MAMKIPRTFRVFMIRSLSRRWVGRPPMQPWYDRTRGYPGVIRAGCCSDHAARCRTESVVVAHLLLHDFSFHGFHVKFHRAPLGVFRLDFITVFFAFDFA